MVGWLTTMRVRSATAMIGVIAVATCWAPGADAASVRSIQFDLAKGSVGGLKLGVATRSRVIERLGRPVREHRDAPGGSPGDRRLEYSCGTGCVLMVQLDSGRTLELVWAYARTTPVLQRGIRTRAGSYLGMARAEAERRERRRMKPGCVTQLVKNAGDIRLEVGAASGPRVDILIMAITGASVLC